MPYTDAQLRKFALMEKRGEKVPADWKQYAKKQLKGKKTKRKK
jgi:hypothetical protein